LIQFVGLLAPCRTRLAPEIWVVLVLPSTTASSRTALRKVNVSTARLEGFCNVANWTAPLVPPTPSVIRVKAPRPGSVAKSDPTATMEALLVVLNSLAVKKQAGASVLFGTPSLSASKSFRSEMPSPSVSRQELRLGFRASNE